MIKHVTILLALILTGMQLQAAVLPEDRTEVLYHRYDGGGVTIDGPSVLVRKDIANKVSVWGNYYMDFVTSASPDVLSQGSPYTEERTETGAGIDYLRGRTTMSLSISQSSESDYDAETVGFGISQEFFGDLSTISLNYSQGNDTVKQNGTPEFSEPAHHQRFGVGWTQILSKSWIMAVNAETVLDEGFLNNPYRSVRFLTNTGNVGFQKERYPSTRNSDAYAIRSMYYLPYRASLRAEARYFTDSWGITANNYELRYIHPYKDQFIFEAKVRTYSQSQASFYSDLFPHIEAQNFLASDKEMSEFSDLAIGLGVSYEIKASRLKFFDKAVVNLYWDNIAFDYANYSYKVPPNPGDENAVSVAIGEEPLYSFNANVIRFFLSAWY